MRFKSLRILLDKIAKLNSHENQFDYQSAW